MKLFNRVPAIFKSPFLILAFVTLLGLVLRLINVSPYKIYPDTYSYIFIDGVDKSKNVYVVQDMGMNDYFPNFSKFLDENLQEYLIASYKVNQIYHSKDISHNEKLLSTAVAAI